MDGPTYWYVLFVPVTGSKVPLFTVEGWLEGDDSKDNYATVVSGQDELHLENCIVAKLPRLAPFPEEWRFSEANAKLRPALIQWVRERRDDVERSLIAIHEQHSKGVKSQP